MFITRFPVILRCFHLNPGSGGKGFHRGGDGIVREILFRKKQVFSILSERRAFSPYGLKGKPHSYLHLDVDAEIDLDIDLGLDADLDYLDVE